jgi:hypothetical protein
MQKESIKTKDKNSNNKKKPRMAIGGMNFTHLEY